MPNMQSMDFNNEQFTTHGTAYIISQKKAFNNHQLYLLFNMFTKGWNSIIVDKKFHSW